ncbi:MAG: hypothetical protein ABIR33_17140 [Pyrinomonadaceae bacterium]
MSASKRWWITAGIVVATALGAACSSGSSSSSSTTGTSSTTSSTTGSGGGSTTSTTGSGGGSTTSTTGAGGESSYTCNTCLDPAPGAGAKAKECKAQGDACFQNKNCVQLFNCTYQGTVDGMGNAVGPCDNSAAGACCTFDCYALIKSIAGDSAGQEAIMLYEAVDQCTTCGVCKDVCDGADLYCAKYAMGPNACP